MMKNQMLDSQAIITKLTQGVRMIFKRRCKSGYHFYSNISHQGSKIQVFLGTTQAEAHINLGKMLEAADRGFHPNASRMAIKSIKIPDIDERYVQAIEKHIMPFFGERKISEIDEEMIAEYCISRWGKNRDGKIMAVKSTWDKERRALKYLIQTIVKGWEPPQIKTVENKKKGKHPLTPEEVELVGSAMSEKYRAVYWIMAYTGMDIGDALSLAPEHIDTDGGWIRKQRGKTGSMVSLPIGQSLKAVLKSIPTPLNKETPFLSALGANGVKMAVRRGFDKAGLPEYSSKDLRRFIASRLQDAGYSYEWIAKALGHAPGSSITERYAGVYDETLRNAFDKIERKVNQ